VLGTPPKIGVESPRITIEVLPWTELRRIHEDRDDEEAGAAACFVDERQVSLVQCPHRGNHAHHFAIVPSLVARSCNLESSAQDLWGHDYSRGP